MLGQSGEYHQLGSFSKFGLNFLWVTLIVGAAGHETLMRVSMWVPSKQDGVFL